MQTPGTVGQHMPTFMYDASGTIATGGTPQLIVPQHVSRSSFIFTNNSDTAMYLEIGSARATAALTNGKVSSVSVTNGGFGFTIPPIVSFLGGGNTSWNQNNSTFLGCGQPGYASPGLPAQAHAVLTGDNVTSIVVDDGGAQYVTPPYVFISNSPNDPFGAAEPSASVGILISAGGSFTNNETICTTDPISVFCETTGKAYTFKFTL